MRLSLQRSSRIFPYVSAGRAGVSRATVLATSAARREAFSRSNCFGDGPSLLPLVVLSEDIRFPAPLTLWRARSPHTPSIIVSAVRARKASTARNPLGTNDLR